MYTTKLTQIKWWTGIYRYTGMYIFCVLESDDLYFVTNGIFYDMKRRFQIIFGFNKFILKNNTCLYRRRFLLLSFSKALFADVYWELSDFARFKGAQLSSTHPMIRELVPFRTTSHYFASYHCIFSCVCRQASFWSSLVTTLDNVILILILTTLILSWASIKSAFHCTLYRTVIRSKSCYCDSRH